VHFDTRFSQAITGKFMTGVMRRAASQKKDPPVSRVSQHRRYLRLVSAAHYAESFAVMPGRCFRLVNRPDAHGQPDHCPAPVVRHGVFKDKAGKRHQVDACAGHARDLEPGSITTA
jgi:hypothetical protein